jgi:glycosyltransferase 2 family protein
MSLEDILNGFRNANYFYISLSVLAALLAHYARAIRWSFLIRPLGYRVSYFRSFIAVMVAYMVNFALPRAGELSRCMVLNRSDSVPVNKLIGTVIVERLFDLIILLGLFFIYLLIELDKLKELFLNSNTVQSGKLDHVLSYKTLIILLAILALGIVLLILLKKSKRSFKKHSLYIKFREMIQGFLDGIKSIRTMKNKWSFLFMTLLIWIGYYLMAYSLLFAMQQTSHLGFLVGFSILTVGSLGFIMPVQGGIGTYHTAVVIALGIYAVDPEVSKIFALLSHTSQMLVQIFVGALLYLVFIFIKKRKHEGLSKTDTENIPPGNSF